jgi:hypothetical protein
MNADMLINLFGVAASTCLGALVAFKLNVYKSRKQVMEDNLTTLVETRQILTEQSGVCKTLKKAVDIHKQDSYFVGVLGRRVFFDAHCRRPNMSALHFLEYGSDPNLISAIRVADSDFNMAVSALSSSMDGLDKVKSLVVLAEINNKLTQPFSAEDLCRVIGTITFQSQQVEFKAAAEQVDVAMKGLLDVIVRLTDLVNKDFPGNKMKSMVVFT